MKRTFLMLLVLTTTFLSAEELDLSSFIDLAVQESESVKAANEGVEAADADETSVFVSFFPTMSVSANYMRLWYVPEMEQFSLPLGNFAAPAQHVINGVADNNPNATQEQIMKAAAEKMTIPFPGGPDYQRTVDITVAQPLTPLWSVYNGYEVKKLVKDIQKIQKKLTKDQVALQVTEYYYNYLMLTELEKLLGETKEQLDRYEIHAKNFVDAGMSDKRALLKISIEQARLKKEMKKTLGAKRVVKKAIALLINREDDSFAIKETDVTFTPMKREGSELLTLQKQYRHELKMLKKSDQVAENLEDLSIQPLIPTVALAGGYKRNFDANAMAPEGTLFLGLNASWDVGLDWIKNYKGVQKAKHERAKTLYENALKRKQMRLQVEQLATDIDVKQSEIEIARSEVAEAKENLRIEENKYKQHMTTETDLLDATLSLKRAQTSSLSARYSYVIALESLAKTIGVPVEKLL